MNWFITGDTHRNFDKIEEYINDFFPVSSSLIILGDAGINYFLDESDNELKKRLNNLECNFYLVRGNHEERPENLPNMVEVYDDNVKGYIYMEPRYKKIRYFIDGEEYYINDQKTLVIGGAYSIDKDYRLAVGWNWFEEEQLNEEERDQILSKVKGKQYDTVLSHTCPESFKYCATKGNLIFGIDNTMELFLENIKESISYDRWYFGHFHEDLKCEDNAYCLFEYILPFGTI